MPNFPQSQWNRIGMDIPSPPPVNASGNDSHCASEQRPSETPEDKALAAVGWRLFGAYQGGWGIRVVGAQSDEDGMCRPLGYNYFVFEAGSSRFVGTLSPVLMDSRTDGSVENIRIERGGNLSVDFARYQASDPLCCPSATTMVTFGLAGGIGGDVMAALKIETTPNGP
jgi:hypothetical protein